MDEKRLSMEGVDMNITEFNALVKQWGEWIEEERTSFKLWQWVPRWMWTTSADPEFQCGDTGIGSGCVSHGWDPLPENWQKNNVSVQQLLILSHR